MKTATETMLEMAIRQAHPKPIRRAAITVDTLTGDIVGVYLETERHGAAYGVQTVLDGQLVSWSNWIDDKQCWMMNAGPSTGRYANRWLEPAEYARKPAPDGKEVSAKFVAHGWVYCESGWQIVCFRHPNTFKRYWIMPDGCINLDCPEYRGGMFSPKPNRR